MRNRLNIHISKAFTLVECMVSLFVIALILAGAFTMAGVGFQLLDLARSVTQVNQIVQTSIEDLRLEPYTVLQDTAKYPPSKKVTVDTEFVGNLYHDYDVWQTVDRSQPGRITFIITATWLSHSRVQNSRWATTTIYEKGLNDFSQRIYSTP